MVRPYPNNVLSGETDDMRAMFSEVLKKLKTQAALAAGGSDRENDLRNREISQSDIAPSAAAGLSWLSGQTYHCLSRRCRLSSIKTLTGLLSLAEMSSFEAIPLA